MEFFLLGTPKASFCLKNLTQRSSQSGPFFKKKNQGTFFDFQKKGGEASVLGNGPFWGNKKTQLLKVKNSLLELEKFFIELKGTELKYREVRLKER